MTEEKETDQDRFFITFKSIIESVIEEKKKDNNWAKKIAKFQCVVQFRIRLETGDLFFCHLVAKDGSIQLVKGPSDTFDFELISTPDDFFYYTNRTYSTLSMLLKKNKYGEQRLSIKKGGTKLAKILFLSKLLKI